MSQPLIVSFRPDAALMCLSDPPLKTMTRRIFKLGDMCFDKRCIYCPPSSTRAVSRTVWTIGESIAIKPKRTAKAIGRVMCVGLKVEHVQDISEEDAKAEGVDCLSTYRWGFELVWSRLNPRGPNSWDANPLVVCIEMRPLKEGEI